MTMPTLSSVNVEIPGNTGPAGTTAAVNTDGTMAANSDAVVPSQKAVVTYVTNTAVVMKNKSFEDSTTKIVDNLDNTKALQFQIAGFSTGTTRTLTPPNYDGTIATLAGSETFTNKTYAGGTYSGTFGGTRNRTGLDVITLGNSTTSADYVSLYPSDYGTGKPRFYISKTTTADKYNIGLFDGVNNNGNINIQCSNFTWNDGTVMTLGASETITGLKTITRGNATTLANILRSRPSDYGVGKPEFFLNKLATANAYEIGLFDSVDTSGTINIQCGTLTWNNSPVVTRGAAETITGLKTLQNGNSTTFAAWLLAQPTDYGPGKPRLAIEKATTATVWNITLYDSVDDTGTLNIGASSFTHKGVALARVDGPVFTLPPRLPTYTVATLPSAATYVRGLIYVSDGTSNKRQAVSDGTNWRWPDGAIVS